MVSLIALAAVAAGIATSIYMNCVNRSLWLDEAMLAYSFSKRSFLQLWNGPLEWLQSAPLGWLYFEKTLALLFGTTESALRVGSIIGFVLTLFIIYTLLSKHDLSPALCLCACAYFANMPFALKYANVFKPYMFDGFVVLLAALLFHLYLQRRLRLWTVTLVWAVLVWFSTPVCFLEGGLLIAAGIPCLINRDFKKLKEIILLGAVVGVSFLANYFFWLGDKSTVQEMKDYWDGQNFPLIPTSAAEFKKMRQMTTEIICQLGPHQKAVFLLCVFAFLSALKHKQTTIIGCCLGVLISLFASWINMYPIEDRMWFFIYPLMLLLAFFGLDAVTKEGDICRRLALCLFIGALFFTRYNLRGLLSGFLVSFAVFELLPQEPARNVRRILAMILALFLTFSVNGIRQYWNNADAVYWSNEELNPELAYLEENLKSDEYVYVFRFSVPGFQFKNGYDNDSIAGFKNNVTFGRCLFQEDVTKQDSFYIEDVSYEDEIARVVSRDKVYLVSSHINAARVRELINAVHEKGFLQLVLYDYNTPLWFFCRNLEDSKIHVSYETVSVKSFGKQTVVIVRLKNEGPAYINHQYEDVKLIDTETGKLYSLSKDIKPGASVELTLTYEGNTPPTFILENEFGLICPDSAYTPATNA